MNSETTDNDDSASSACSADASGVCAMCGSAITEDEVTAHGFHVDEETDSDICKACFDRDKLPGCGEKIMKSENGMTATFTPNG